MNDPLTIPNAWKLVVATANTRRVNQRKSETPGLEVGAVDKDFAAHTGIIEFLAFSKRRLVG